MSDSFILLILLCIVVFFIHLLMYILVTSKRGIMQKIVKPESTVHFKTVKN